MIAALAAQFGLDEVPESTGSISAGGRDWTLHQSVVQGNGADIALAEEGGLTYIIILGAADEDRDFLYDGVFLPALEAVTAEPADFFTLGHLTILAPTLLPWRQPASAY